MLKYVLNFFKTFLENETKLIDFLFPPICAVCEEINKNWLCEKCKNNVYKEIENKLILNNRVITKICREKKYKYVNKYLCKKRVKLVNNLGKRYIFKKFDKLLYIFRYKGIIRKLIIDYKFNDKPFLNNFFSNIILNNKFDCDIFKVYDIIISVPLSRKRFIERGYNQTELIAKNISKRLNIFYKKDILFKVKEVKRQSSLNKNERTQNIKNVFKFNNKYNIKEKNVILIDDVYTTGSTIDECCRILRKEKVKNILVLIIAKN